MNELDWMVLMEDYHLDGEWEGAESIAKRPFSQAKFYREEWTQYSEYALDGTPGWELFQMFLYLSFCLRSQESCVPGWALLMKCLYYDV